MRAEYKSLELPEDSPERNDLNRIFELVIMTGELLLQNGAEIFRVQETMTIIANSYQVKNFDIYVLSNGLFMTMDMEYYGIRTAKIKHIPISPPHLGRVTAVNNLSRNIVDGHYTVEEAIKELHRISTIPYEANALRILFAGIGSACFCYMLGGNLYDSLVAFLSGLILYVFIIYTEKASIPKVLINVFGGALVTIISIVLFSLGFGNSFNHIMIGSIICLVPGVSFTTSVRDFFNEDYLSGTIHLVDALLVAVSISVGVGVIMTLWKILQ